MPKRRASKEEEEEEVAERVEEVDSTADASSDEENEDAAVPNEEAATKSKRPARKKKAKKEEPSATSSLASATAPNAQLIPSQVYVEGLPYEATQDSVRSFFASHGCAPIVSMRLPTWQDNPNRLRGSGHIVFESESLAERAISHVNGKTMPGHTRYVSVQRPNQPKAAIASTPREQPANCNKVFIKNLPYDTTEAEIEEVFRVCGKINADGVRLARNAEKQVKGFGYVEYKTAEGAAAAVAKAAKPFGMTVKGRPVFVDFDEGKPKNSFKDLDGRNFNKLHKKAKGGQQQQQQQHTKK